MILHTPDLIRVKDERARGNIGKHLLVAIWCKDGVVIGRRANERSASRVGKTGRKFPNWLLEYDKRLYFASIGAYSDIEKLHTAINSQLDDLKTWVTARYVSKHYADQVISFLFELRYEHSLYPYGAMTTVFSLEAPLEFSMSDYSGKVRSFSQFVVAGAALETDACKDARRGAVDFLNKECKNARAEQWMIRGKGTSVLLSALRRFDLPGESQWADVVSITADGVLWKRRMISRRRIK